jgi:hypothetical protein
VNIDDTLHGISTPLQVNVRDVSLQATGFFYEELAAEDPNIRKGYYYWREVKETWIVSNRHVFLPKLEGKELIPDLITFYMRKPVGGGLQWDIFTLRHEDINQRLKTHADPTVDVAILRIGDLVPKRIHGQNDWWTAVSVENLPNNCNIPVQVADDVIIIGYPRGFYDTHNLFPIVKSGIVASRWGMHFQNKPLFLIDAKLFPGSSGSLVLSKPTYSIVTDGPIAGSKEAHFAFLGVYSGEPFLQAEPIDLDDITITRKYGFNLGTVWYAELVVDIVNKGTISP